MSKYDDYWLQLLSRIRSLLVEARLRGTSQRLSVIGLSSIGKRKSWNGTVTISKSGAKSAMAHTTSLGNVLLESGILNSFENATFLITVSNKLDLCAKLLSQKDTLLQFETQGPTRPTTLEKPILELEDYGQFYRLIRNLELDIRNFIVETLGKGWIKRIKNDLPNVSKNWKERMDTDDYWGIEPEENPINYADQADYIQIVTKYSKVFSEGPEDLAGVVTNFKILANRGRNPLMHFRTLTDEGFFSASSAEKFLRRWMKRIADRRARAVVWKRV